MKFSSAATGKKISRGRTHGSGHDELVTRRHTAFHTARMASHGAARRPIRHTWCHMAADGVTWRPANSAERRTAPHCAARRHTAPQGGAHGGWHTAQSATRRRAAH
eukprot:gene11886-biopygen1474